MARVFFFLLCKLTKREKERERKKGEKINERGRELRKREEKGGKWGNSEGKRKGKEGRAGGIARTFFRVIACTLILVKDFRVFVLCGIQIHQANMQTLPVNVLKVKVKCFKGKNPGLLTLILYTLCRRNHVQLLWLPFV